MSDQGFNFAPPPPRRERKEFEPPPWEKDQFDNRAKLREADTASNNEASQPAEPEIEIETGAADSESPETVSQREVKGEQVLKTTPLDETKVAEMMFELRAEEIPATQMYAKATLAAGVTLLLIGTVMVIWSIVMIVVAVRRGEQGRAGVFIGLTVLLFGAGFAGTGAWFVFKTLRQQGVL